MSHYQEKQNELSLAFSAGEISEVDYKDEMIKLKRTVSDYAVFATDDDFTDDIPD